MEPMGAPKKPGIMAKLRNRKGFSLIEMAIVLVIIGIIIAAIVKGQDLFVNARTKQLVAASNNWKASAYGYMDRNGVLPGDTGNKNGIIGDDSTVEQLATGTAIDQLEGTMSSLPTNPVIVGGMSFYFFFGNAVNDLGTGHVSVIAICKDSVCAGKFTSDEAALINAADTALDGAADGGTGSFRASVIPNISTLALTTNGRINGYATSAVVKSTKASPFVAGTDFAAIWAFDRSF